MALRIRGDAVANITVGQFALLVVTTILFAAAFVIGLRNIRHATDGATESGRGSGSIGTTARAAIGIATLLDLALLLWRASNENRLSLPLSNHFDAFTLLAFLLAIVLLYLRWTRHLRNLSFFLLPMIVVLLLLGALLSILFPRPYGYGGIWMRLHIATIIAGTFCFAALAASAGSFT